MKDWEKRVGAGLGGAGWGWEEDGEKGVEAGVGGGGGAPAEIVLVRTQIRPVKYFAPNICLVHCSSCWGRGKHPSRNCSERFTRIRLASSIRSRTISSSCVPGWMAWRASSRRWRDERSRVASTY